MALPSTDLDGWKAYFKLLLEIEQDLLSPKEEISDIIEVNTSEGNDS